VAKLPNSRVVLRFRLGDGLVKGRQRYENTARAIMNRVAFSYANDQYDTMRKTLEQTVERDVRAELVHLAYLFRRHIIGAAGTRTTPAGQLDTAAKGQDAPRQSISASLPAWARRNTEYLRQKRQATGGIGWFDNRGWRQSQWDARYASRVPRRGGIPDDTGLLFESMRADVWETMFGPISVRFRKSHKLMVNQADFSISTTGDKHAKFQIGSIQVRALGRITPSMLPGLNTGFVRATVAYNAALVDVIAGFDPRLAYRLGRMRNGVYRPTLEPFLGFFLTRALPHAVDQRIKKQTLGSLFNRRP
jgi:hypothetical protein